MHRNNLGFSLAEFSVALAILGLTLALTVPPFQRSLQRARQERASAELQSDLKLAISNAKATGRTVRLSFGGGGYEIRDAVDSTLIRTRDFGGHVSIATSGDPLVFPWGLVQPTDVELTGPHYYKSFRILPTGRIDNEVANGL